MTAAGAAAASESNGASSSLSSMMARKHGHHHQRREHQQQQQQQQNNNISSSHYSDSSSSSSSHKNIGSRHKNDMTGGNSSDSKRELHARLQAMRQSVEEKQRHVSSLFFGNKNDNNDDVNGNDTQSRFVFSIFDRSDSESDFSFSTNNNNGSSRTLGTLDSVKNMTHQPTSILGAYSHEEDAADEAQRDRTHSTASPTTTTTTSSGSSPSSQRGSTRESRSRGTNSGSDEDDDLESSGIEWTTDCSSSDAAAAAGVVGGSTSSMTPVEDMLFGGTARGRNKNMKQKKNDAPPVPPAYVVEAERKRSSHIQQQQQQHARSLTVPIGAGYDNDKTTDAFHDEQQQPYGQVGKSNRKSLLAGLLCCCGGDHGEVGKVIMPDYEEHLGEGRQYWRDIILGVNDGLVSTFLLIAGVAGANLSSTDILLTALSGTIAGAISMAAGEYVATKTQQEVMDGEIALERKHISKNRDFELLELKEAFGVIGIPEEDNSEEVVHLRRLLMNYYAKNDEAHVKVHAVLELGVVDEEKRNPFIAGGVAFFLFFFGALPSVIPFLCTSNIETALVAAAICTTTALLLVGAVKTWATRGSLLVASLENLLIAAGGGCIAYGVGVGFEKLVNG